MRVQRSEQFIIRDFEFYDSGVLAAYGPMLFDLYEVLRRYVWRSDVKGVKVQRQLWREGLLTTLVSQTELGEQLNVSRQTVSKYLREMKELGWIQTKEGLDDRELVYVLGERLLTSDGQRHEVFFADAWMRNIWEGLEQEAKAEEMTVRALPIAHRMQFVRELSIAIALSNELTGPVKPALQGVESQLYRACKTSPTGGSELSIPTGRNDSGNSGTENAKNREGNREEEIENDLASPKILPSSNDSPPTPLPGSSKENVSAADRKVILAKLSAEASVKQKAAREKKMRKRRDREEKSANLKGKGAAKAPGMRALEKVWLEAMKESFPTIPTAKWAGKEFGQAKQLSEKYDAFIVRTAFRYVIGCWTNIRDRYFKGRGVAPSLGTLLKFHDSLFPEAQQWVELHKVKEKYDRWFVDNPNNPYPPADLEKRYQAAQEGLKALGLD